MEAEPTWWADWIERRIVHQATHPQLGNWITQRLHHGEALPVYCGFDPTADSLHLGGLVPVLGLRRFKNVGLKPIVVVGGATGMIGDPSGKSSERTLLSRDQLAHNVAALGRQLETLLDGKAGKDFLLVDNLDWIGPLRLVDFLRDIGKHFSVNMMTQKESVKARLESREQGISFTEFSYMLLQAYDFLHLFETHGCRLQIGGSDQWGNITAGIDLIHHRHHGAEVHGCTLPLVTMSDGRKFGKSEQGNVWLDGRKTHPYFLYKYLFDLPDADAGEMLHGLTLLPSDEAKAVAEEAAAQPQSRAAQRRLARATTMLVHGEAVSAACAGLESAMHADDAETFERHAAALGLLDPTQLVGVADQQVLPVAHRPLTLLAGEGINVADLAVELGLFSSKGEVRREVQSGHSGFVVGGATITDINCRLTTAALANRRVVLFRKGKRNKRMVCFYDAR